MHPLKLTLIQPALYWQNVPANLNMLEETIWQIDETVDLIVLPEMFNSGFTMEPESVAEPMNLTTCKWLRQMAEQTKAVVTGSFVVKENGRFFNRLIWMPPDGEWDKYDKRHLFRMAGEHDRYASGDDKMIKEIKGWKVCPLICYDLRFPVWCRSTPGAAYDLLLVVANWPQVRADAWDTLLKARAIENLCYTAGVNRSGEDGNGIVYGGNSVIYDPKGTVVHKAGRYAEISTHTLSKASLTAFRQQFPAHLDADEFTIREAGVRDKVQGTRG